MNALKTTSLLVATLCSAYVGAARADDTLAPASQLTRAEVLADLEVWTLAGMPTLAGGDAGTDLYSAEYKAAQAKYQQMVASPEFAQRVIRIARQRGERVDIAAK
jgi:Domain of unknown function (DUF4148)